MKGVVSYDIEVLAANHCLALVYGGDGTMVVMEPVLTLIPLPLSAICINFRPPDLTVT